MARKSRRQMPPSEILELTTLESYWDLFKHFQAGKLKGLLPGADKTFDQGVSDMLEQHEEEAHALFAAGFTSGWSSVLMALQEAHDEVHMMEAARHVPDNKRPRA